MTVHNPGMNVSGHTTGGADRVTRPVSIRDVAAVAQVTKTGIIVGMGEEMHELLTVFRDLADRKVDILTMHCA